MIGIVDNFDSFTYNIVALIEALGHSVVVVNHHTSVQQCLTIKAKAWILGPGPGGPADTGVCKELIGKAPILGICLGHQLLGHCFGGKVDRTAPHHGKCSQIYHDATALFQDLPQGFLAARYHSLVVTHLPACLKATAWTQQGDIMALQHLTEPVFGLQYHPDSVATEYGIDVIRNFLRLIA